MVISFLTLHNFAYQKVHLKDNYKKVFPFAEDIKKAYKTLAREIHPDKVGLGSFTKNYQLVARLDLEEHLIFYAWMLSKNVSVLWKNKL